MVPGVIYLLFQQNLGYKTSRRRLNDVHNGSAIRTLEVEDVLTNLNGRLGIPIR